MRRAFSMLLAVCLLAAGSPGIADSQSALPEPYSSNTLLELYKSRFPSYDAQRGIITEIKTSDGQPAGIEWGEAKLWNARGRQLLVSVFSIGTNDSSPHICGICGRRFA